MVEERKKFILYEYLIYFWKNKWLFLLISILTPLLLVVGVLVLKDDKAYTGEVLFFTGSVNADDLTHPNNIKAKFNENLSTEALDVFVSEKSQVKFTLKDDSKENIQKDLETIIESYSKELQNQATMEISTTSDYAKSLEERELVLEETLKIYKDKLEKSQGELNSISELILRTEEEFTKTKERAYKLKSDLVFYEKPKVLSQEVSKTDTYFKELVAIGVIIGLVLAIAFLSLLKYVKEAKAT